MKLTERALVRWDWLPVMAIAVMLVSVPASMADTVLVTTENGVGADAFVRKGVPDGNYGAASTMQVKNETGSWSTYWRKTYLRFDFQLDAATLVDASLQLSISNDVPTGYTLNVYGLNDGLPGEDWLEGIGTVDSPAPDGITWNNAPANVVGSGSAVTADATFLGTLAVDGEWAPGNTATLAGDALLGFLKADSNERVTVIITRSEMSNDTHAFASKETSTGFSAPSLILTVQHSPIPISSSDPATAFEIAGTLADQLSELNVGPPPFDPGTWQPVLRMDDNDNGHDPFRCHCGDLPPEDACWDSLSPDPPNEPWYVSADDYLPNADEVTLDNCSSAFYRFTFELPSTAMDPVLSGVANTDDQAVLFLNYHQISGSMHIMGIRNCDPGPCECCEVGPADPDCEPCEPLLSLEPADPCYDCQDAAANNGDMFDDEGRQILTWPTRDPFSTSEASYFVAGQNELVFGVCGDASYFEPTGLEFQATVSYTLRGDGDLDGDLDIRDFGLVQRCFTGEGGGPISGDCMRFDFDEDDDVDLDDSAAFVH